MCLYKHTFCLNSEKNAKFYPLDSIVKFAYCQQYKSRVYVLLAIVGNGHILLWDLMSNISILQS